MFATVAILENSLRDLARYIYEYVHLLCYIPQMFVVNDVWVILLVDLCVRVTNVGLNGRERERVAGRDAWKRRSCAMDARQP